MYEYLSPVYMNVWIHLQSSEIFFLLEISPGYTSCIIDYNNSSVDVVTIRLPLQNKVDTENFSKSDISFFKIIITRCRTVALR